MRVEVTCEQALDRQPIGIELDGGEGVGRLLKVAAGLWMLLDLPDGMVSAAAVVVRCGPDRRSADVLHIPPG